MSCSDGTHERYPLKRLDFALNKLIKVTSYHLDMLAKQKTNIEQYQSMELWSKVVTEETNASRTVQQLSTDIDEMETMAQQVSQQDLQLFWDRVNPIRNQILTQINIFLALHSEATQPVHLGNASPKSNAGLSPASSFLFDSGTSVQQEQQLLIENEQVIKADFRLESWERLKQELVDLNSALHGFAHMVLGQREKVERIEQNVVSANENVHQGTGFLKKAAVLKAAMLPMTGAVIGGAFAGPVGFFVGLKAAGICAVGGTVLGYFGGRLYQKRKNRNINRDVELHPLENRQRSYSLSDLQTNSSDS